MDCIHTPIHSDKWTPYTPIHKLYTLVYLELLPAGQSVPSFILMVREYPERTTYLPQAPGKLSYKYSTARERLKPMAYGIEASIHETTS